MSARGTDYITLSYSHRGESARHSSVGGTMAVRCTLASAVYLAGVSVVGGRRGFICVLVLCRCLNGAVCKTSVLSRTALDARIPVEGGVVVQCAQDP